MGDQASASPTASSLPTTSGTGLPSEIDRVFDQITAEFIAASRHALEWFGRRIDIDNKATDGYDPVTEADRAVEDRIRAIIAEHFPDHSVVGEERGRVDGVNGPSDTEWVIDPIDGTRAFVTGRPMWGALIGLSIGGTPRAGWMHLPVLGQTWVGDGVSASFAEGEWTGRAGARQVNTSSTTELTEAVLFATHPSMFVDEAADAFDRIESQVRLSRFDGDCANYGLLASGHGDLVVENMLQPYDIVPLVPIIEGAGGVVTGRDGGPVGAGWAIAASTPELHRAALAALGPTSLDA